MPKYSAKRGSQFVGVVQIVACLGLIGLILTGIVKTKAGHVGILYIIGSVVHILLAISLLVGTMKAWVDTCKIWIVGNYVMLVTGGLAVIFHISVSLNIPLIVFMLVVGACQLLFIFIVRNYVSEIQY